MKSFTLLPELQLKPLENQRNMKLLFCSCKQQLLSVLFSTFLFQLLSFFFLRTEILECLGDLDFLAKLHCVRQACEVHHPKFSSKDHRKLFRCVKIVFFFFLLFSSF